MFPSTFEYYAPSSLQEALSLLGNGNKVLAGGHSLLPLMKLRLAEPAGLVDIGHLPGLDGIRDEGDTVVIGARVTHQAVEHSSLLASAVPLLPQTARWVGDIQVRNRGTIGGSLVHADPGADLPAAILALDATLVARDTRGQRHIAAGDFFQGLLATSLADEELLTEIRVSKLPAGTGTAYQKFPNPASRYAIVGIAVTIGLDSAGAIASAAIGVTGLADRPFRAAAAEAALLGQRPVGQEVAAAAALVPQGQEAAGDIHASPAYRAHLAQVLAQRAIVEAGALARP
ncbi:MAG TPA: xanthine dehydrogenase family protein subunit M [Chloroflexota bacterium]|nr:xanthine dehydrogenase family protein subunit M [Chloroflexota bacterium]